VGPKAGATPERSRRPGALRVDAFMKQEPPRLE
jgi:hypothetical protein